MPDLIQNSIGNSRPIFPEWVRDDESSSVPADLVSAGASEAALDAALAELEVPADQIAVMNRNDKWFAVRTAYERGDYPVETPPEQE